MATFEFHHYHHFVLDFDSGVTAKLDRVLTQLASLKAQGVAEMQELDTLKTQVEKTDTVIGSAITLIQGLAAQITALKTDPVALQALADSLNTNTQALAEVLVAN